MFMKKLTIFISLLWTISFVADLTAADNFPKCSAACNKYYSCVVEKNPNATSDQKDKLKKGCELNCNKAKYYNQISACYDKGANSCVVYWNCITKAVQK